MGNVCGGIDTQKVRPLCAFWLWLSLVIALSNCVNVVELLNAFRMKWTFPVSRPYADLWNGAW